MSLDLNHTGLLNGQLALITGAASGIGQAIAVAYAQAGARVIVSDRALADCQSTLTMVRAHRADCVAFALDVTRTDAAKALALRIKQEIGDVTVLVNNAGLLIREGVDSPRVHDNLQRMMDVNYFGSFNVLHAFLPALRRTHGCVINIVSGAALSGLAQCVGYSASKGALKMLTQSMAADLGPDGIRVNAIAPGVIDTPMTEATRNNPERLARFLARIPMQRIGQPHEIAGPAVFLASPLASYVNGVTLSVDGGKQAV